MHAFPSSHADTNVRREDHRYVVRSVSDGSRHLIFTKFDDFEFEFKEFDTHFVNCRSLLTFSHLALLQNNSLRNLFQRLAALVSA